MKRTGWEKIKLGRRQKRDDLHCSSELESEEIKDCLMIEKINKLNRCEIEVGSGGDEIMVLGRSDIWD